MKRECVEPHLEVLEIELEGAILALCDVPGGTEWNFFDEFENLLL